LNVVITVENILVNVKQWVIGNYKDEVPILILRRGSCNFGNSKGLIPYSGACGLFTFIDRLAVKIEDSELNRIKKLQFYTD